MTNFLIGRRDLLGAIFATITFPGFAGSTWAAADSYPAIQAYRNPGCVCCEKWAEHLRQAGFTVTLEDDAALDDRRTKAGVPAEITGCHTAFMGEYVIEGHVPVADIIRLLALKPAIRGLAVSGMPMGSPGMENGDNEESFKVFAFKSEGTWEEFSNYS